MSITVKFYFKGPPVLFLLYSTYEKVQRIRGPEKRYALYVDAITINLWPNCLKGCFQLEICCMRLYNPWHGFFLLPEHLGGFIERCS